MCVLNQDTRISRIRREYQMAASRAKITSGGRLVIPAEFRRALGLREGDEVILELKADELRILSLAEAIKRSQAIIRQYVPPGRPLADSFIAERHQEVEIE